MKIAAVLMVKNEMKRIHVTLESIKELDALIVFDTGSTDNTVEFIRENCPIPVHIKCGEFVDFKISGNELLNFADECATEFKYDYYVLLDANDEFIGEKPTITNDKQKTWLVERHFKYGVHDTMTFWSVKLLKAHTGIKYDGVVHEYLNGCDDATKISDFYIFQDRTLDDDKSQHRWHADKPLLQKALDADPSNTRTLFYLAQTHACICEYEDAYRLYAQRSNSVGGFEEERWYSMMQCAEIGLKINKEWDVVMGWLLKALTIDMRAEALVILADHYLKQSAHDLAYLFAKAACDLSYPIDKLLFVERKVYDYTRWHKLSIAAWYVAKKENNPEKFIVGKLACQRAIDSKYDIATDSSNMKWYEIKSSI